MRSEEINAYIQEVTGEAFTAKDFHSWSATVLAAVALAVSTGARSAHRPAAGPCPGPCRMASYLGNTPAVCRSSYVDPRVVDHYLAGATINAAVDGLAGRRAPPDCPSRERWRRRCSICWPTGRSPSAGRPSPAHQPGVSMARVSSATGPGAVGEQGETATLAAQHLAPQLLRLGRQGVAGPGVEDGPAAGGDLPFELAAAPAGVAGEEAHGLHPGGGLDGEVDDPHVVAEDGLEPVAFAVQARATAITAVRATGPPTNTTSGERRRRPSLPSRPRPRSVESRWDG